MLMLRDIVDELFTCLTPLRMCEEPIQNYLVYPFEEGILDPYREYIVDPIRNALEVNPVGCVPCLGMIPTLPQFDSPTEQDRREAQLDRTQPDYQYNYTLVRTFKVHEGPGGAKVGVPGRGIAILDKVPFSQLPSLCWLLLALREALVVIDNLLQVLDLLVVEPQTENRPMRQAKAEANADGAEEADLASCADPSVTPEEIEQQRARIQHLRANIFGTVAWGRTAANTLRGTFASGERPLHAPVPQREVSTSTFCPCPQCSPLNFTRELFEDIKDDLSNLVAEMLELQAINRHPFSIRAYNELFQRIPLPEFAHTFRNDDMFALQRVAGQNPVVIERIRWDDAREKQFPVTPEQYAKAMGPDDTLEEAGDDGRLYLCDYNQSLGNTIAGDFPPFAGKKYLNVPLALFALDRSNRTIMRPVAIQMNQKPSDTNPVITPDSSPEGRWNWQIAKSVVQNADCNDSEFYRHLGLGHLLTEAFTLATYRQLPIKHPLYVLMTPHFEGTLFTNNTAVTSINDRTSMLNITHAIFSGTVDSTLGIAGNAVANVDYTANMLPNELRSRGVDDPKLLPNYPYRDDALLIWNAIYQWVADYTCIYYRCDLDVQADYELRNWVTELGSRHGSRIKGVGEDGGGIRTLEYLIQCITAVIYTASAHHALTNFPLDDYEIYSPGWPGALYEAPPQSATGASRRDWLSSLAPLNIALLQQALGRVVGSTYYTELGVYPTCHFDDPRVRGPLMAFQRDLHDIEEKIRQRNSTRIMPYTYLLPSRIPQSTNI
jgi:arachidonate 15-lipoxygenase